MDPYIGEIRMMAIVYPPRNWSDCNGAVIDVRQNPALYSIIGARFGGDGVNTFALPDLAGRAPRGAGQGTNLPSAPWGGTEGTTTTTLTVDQMPSHSHKVETYNGTDKTKFSDVPSAAFVARHLVEGVSSVVESFVAGSTATNTRLSAKAVGTTGKSQLHTNMQPYIAMRYCISLMGVYPERP